MELDVKYIIPYIPYKVRATYVAETLRDWEDRTGIISGLDVDDNSVYISGECSVKNISEIKLILRPIADIKKEIVVDGSKFIPEQVIFSKYNRLRGDFRGHKIDFDECLALLKIDKGYDYLPHWIYQDLVKWHFDVFRLIDNSLAVDVNSL